MALIHSVTLACVMSAASLQHVPSVVVLSLMKTEGGRVGHWTTNSNGSHDLGPMQINDTTWVPRLARMQFHGNERKAEAALIYDGCYNVSVGAYIFRRYLDQAGGNLGVAIGYYNSHNPYYADRYRVRFLHSLDKFIKRGTVSIATAVQPAPVKTAPRKQPPVQIHAPVEVANNSAPPVETHFPGGRPSHGSP